MRLCLAALTAGFLLHAEAKPMRLSLDEASKMAESNSAAVAAVKAQREAAEHGHKSFSATYWPNLKLGAEYHYIHEIPSITLGPKTLDLASHHNYSIGPEVRYTVWDFGVRENTAKALKHLANAAAIQETAQINELRFGTKVAYVQAQLAQTQLGLQEGAVELTAKQSEDIKGRRIAGGASDVDYLGAQVQLENAQLRLFQEQSKRSQALHELASLIGTKDVSGVVVDELEAAVREGLAGKSQGGVLEHPRLKAGQERMQSLQSSAASQGAGAWPTIGLQAKTSLDFPNGPVQERVHQTTFGVSVTWTLWDAGMRQHLVSQKNAEAKIQGFEVQETQRILQMDFDKTKSALEYLKKQRQAMIQLVEKMESLAKITYASYKYGKLGLSEVFDTNLRLQETKMRKVQNDAMLLQAIYRIEFLCAH